METALKNDVYELLAPVWSGSVSRDFTAESIVPDAMPDIAAVLDADGVITLRSKETEVGAIVLAASVSVSVLYMPDGSEVMEDLAVQVPVEMRIDAAGADTDCRTVARMRIRAVDARMVNSRKISVRVDVECEAAAYQKRSLTVPSGLGEEGPCAHILTRTAPMASVQDVREKTFVITDEYPYPGGVSVVERILSQRVEAAVEDVKYVSGKVVFRGRIRAALVFGGPEGQVCAGKYETEWSQIMEVDVTAAEVTPEVTLMFTGAYFDLPERQEDGKIAAELHLVAQTVCRQTGELTYIADLYSNRTVLTGQQEQIQLISAARPISMRQTVTGAAEVIGGPGEVLSVSTAVGAVTVEGSTVKTSVHIRAITRQEGGGCTASRCRLAAEFTTDVPAGTELCGVTIFPVDVYCAAAGGGLDIRAVLQMEATAVTKSAISVISGVTEDAEAWAAAPAAPSITLARVEEGADMWAVAKKYRSTVEAIAAANGEKTSGLLLIPKAR